MRLLTPRGCGGIHVVAMAAEERAAALARLTRPDGRPLALRPDGPPCLAILHLDGGLVDEVLVVDRGPEGIEVHLHGSPALLAALAAALQPFAPPEPPSPAERLLRMALSPAALALALEQRALDFAAFLRGLAALPAAERGAAHAAALARSRIALALATPCRLVLAGAQNAGKSTLVNRLLLRDRVLTGPLPGLTRDPVAEPVDLDGYPIEIVDTAGDGPAVDAIDRRAQAAARALREGAWRLLVVDGSRGPGADDRQWLGERTLVVASKADLPAAPWPVDVPCDLRAHALDAAAAPTLRLAVGRLLRERRGLPPGGPVGGPAALDDAQWAALAALGPKP